MSSVRTSRVQGGATNAAPQCRTNKLGLPRILTTSRRCYELLNNKRRSHCLTCCKDFRNLLARKLNDIEEKESILFQRFLLQQ